MVKKLSSGRVGAIAELRFMVECLERGHNASQVATPDTTVDILVDNGKGCKRVQVKCSVGLCKGNDYYAVNTSRQKRVTYKDGDFDYLAVYLVGEKSWYIIPGDKVFGKERIYLHPNKVEVGRYEDYIEKWELLT